MALLIPNEAIARRWRGALQARLRRAPLEEFLRFHNLELTVTGAARDTDNLVQTAFHILHAGLAAYQRTFHGALDETRQTLVAHFACGLCERLATEFAEPSAWRIAALISSAQLLSPQQGLAAAAHATAYAVHDYTVRFKGSRRAGDLASLGERALVSVRSNSPEDFADLVRDIAQRLAAGVDRCAASAG